MPYTAWTFGSVQQACTEQCQFFAESMQPSSAITNSMKWLVCLVKLFCLGSWQLWIENSKFNDYGLPTQIMRCVHVYSVSTTEASFNPEDYKRAQYPISPFTSRWPRDEMPFHQGVHQCLTFDKTTLPEVDSDDEEYLTTADFDDLVWSKVPVPNNEMHLCNHQIPRPAIQCPQLDQMEMALEPEQMDIDPRWPTRPHWCPQRTVTWLWFLGTQCPRLPVVA